MKILYHFTSNEAAEEILKNGFQNGSDGLVWLLENPRMVLGEKCAQCLLKVFVEMEPTELNRHLQLVEELAFGPNGEEIPCPRSEQLYEGARYYSIPAETLNRCSKIFRTPEKQFKRWVS